MLKFQDNYSIEIENMEDLFLISYVMIDELYKQYAPQEVTKSFVPVRKDKKLPNSSDNGDFSKPHDFKYILKIFTNHQQGQLQTFAIVLAFYKHFCYDKGRGERYE